ncbi:MAG: ABC transporter ATP-binding protein/permease, partial [Clostridia bacterium]|nr:ABC transporter ATP-binding protein/permease [Clostridia bacterium]
MLKYFQDKYAMSEKGAKDLFSSIIWTLVMHISFMLPVVLSFKFLDEYMSLLLKTSNDQKHSILYYVIMGIVFFLIMFVIAYFQYNSTYTKIYEESARRRISLAETLRKLPLAFFGKKDIADLSSTIMEDVTQIEMLFSHSVPQIYAGVLAVLAMGIMMFLYNWKLSLAVFWVVPVAVLVFYLSRKFQSNMHTKFYNIKRDISDKIQEGLDSAHEIKSYNREEVFSNTLNSKLDNYEK